ncbi:MAG: hypothetical protein JJE52_10330, partial [Acidimicrobiia bacterium]|nr:hypothetical protein [Acidimicrobiia bacterium]
MTAVALLAGATVVVLLVGPRMARTADDLAEATGLGGALFGVVFLALATDLPEIALTPTAVITGTPRIAVGGLLGSTAAQLTLIAVVDIAFRQGKLVSRVSTTTTLGQCALMMAVLAVVLLPSVPVTPTSRNRSAGNPWTTAAACGSAARVSSTTICGTPTGSSASVSTADAPAETAAAANRWPSACAPRRQQNR